jgi:hypothetical protein
VAFYCGEENINLGSGSEADDCIDPENLTGKFEEISFVPASDFSNDSSTGKFVRELDLKNDSIRRKILSAKQLSHLMEHKIDFIVNGVWLEHDIEASLFPIVSIRNSTGNELEVLYLDCSLADINLQFLDLFDFTSSFVFWCYVVEGFCFVILIGIFIKNGTEDPKDILEVLFTDFYNFSWIITHQFDIPLLDNIFCRLFKFFLHFGLDVTAFELVSFFF